MGGFEPLALLFGLTALFVAVWAAWALRTTTRSHARRRAARRAAEAVGLTDLHPGSRGTPREPLVAGRSGDLRVRLEEYEGSGGSGTRIVVAGPGHGPEGLSLLPESYWTVEKRARGEREIETGDPSFDREFFVQGPAPLALAILGPETRRLFAVMRNEVATASRRSVTIQTFLRDGVLEVRLPDGSSAESLERPPDVLPRVLEVARRLVAPPDLAARIAENLRAEPEAGVRRQCVTTLAREFPGHPATREALLAGLEDPDAEVRVRAGIALGPEGRDVLLAVARGEGAPDETSARAVAGLAAELSVEDASALLQSASRGRRLATARECLGVLGRRGAAAVPTIAKVLAAETSEEAAAAAAEALGATGDASAEPALLSALGSPHAAVRLAATTALGHVGTAAAVMPLREAEEGDVDMRRAARQAIAEIQSRVPGAEPGQLSLAGGEPGELSLAEGEAGELSLTEGSRRE